jgi:hypothetical protein
MPANKLEILVPYLALVGLFGAATEAFTIRKRRKDWSPPFSTLIENVWA